jgi:hypothetical protein
MLKALSARARTHARNERTNVNKASPVQADRVEQPSCSSIGVRDRILAGFANGRERTKRIWGGGIYDQIVAGYPFIKLPRCFCVPR